MCWGAVQRYRTKSGHCGPTPAVRRSRLKRCLCPGRSRDRRVWHCTHCHLKNLCPLKTLGQTMLDPTPFPTAETPHHLNSKKYNVLRGCTKISNQVKPLWPHTCREKKSAAAMSLSWPPQRSKGLTLYPLPSQESLSTENLWSNHVRPHSSPNKWETLSFKLQPI